MPKSLKRIALVVTFGTLLSKFGGLIRQLVIAGAFGVGPAYVAYNYAYVLPGFFLTLVGGINGPLHNGMVTVLSRRNEKEGAYVLAVISNTIIVVLIPISIILYLAADPLVSLIGPGLNPEIHLIATKQLQVMAPMALLAGLIGLGFGSLNAREEFFIPSIAPIISSFALIIGVGAWWISKGAEVDSVSIGIKGGLILAQATLVGAFLQWIIQIPSLIKKGLFKFKFIWDLKHQGVKEVWRIIAPATLSSGMMQINVITDLFFASDILGAAAGLGYANFLVQAPLGLASNALLIPLLPALSKLTKTEQRPQLIQKIRQSLMLSSASMIALGSIFLALGDPIVGIIYGRGAFGPPAVNLVGGILMVYGIGMPAYLGRDLLVRIFYALGDGKTPFKFSIAGIVLNIILDWVFVGGPTPWGDQIPINLGAQGLVLATVGVNILTCWVLLLKLDSKLGNLPIKKWCNDLVKLLFCGILSGILAWIINVTLILPDGVTWAFLKVFIASFSSIIGFCFIGNYFKIKEVNEVIMIVKRKIISR